ncbi:MAG: hypothetical protein OXF27_09705 [Acidobacteria bacterium]|nr:hypothetical protein [Acidobacteriota bacterium]
MSAAVHPEAVHVRDYLAPSLSLCKLNSVPILTAYGEHATCPRCAHIIETERMYEDRRRGAFAVIIAVLAALILLGMCAG